MKAMQDEINEKKNMVDIESIKQLLENLITLSFDQEKLIGRSSNIDIKSPEFKLLIKDLM